MNWKWKNALTDGLPKDKQQVLISVDGVNYVAEFSESDGTFNIPLEGKEKKFSSVKNTVYWIEFIPPQK